MITDDTLAAGEDEFAREDAGEMDAMAEVGSDVFEVELDGEVHSLPAALKGAFLRQADYTRKTQELAEHRRALEAERRALGDHARAQAGVSRERLQLASLDDQIEEFQGVDWDERLCVPQFLLRVDQDPPPISESSDRNCTLFSLFAQLPARPDRLMASGSP